jgi:alpha/beta hydrolase family protein
MSTNSTDENITYVLIHSPLVGPLTWQLVHAEMAQRGIEAIVPTLIDHPNSTQPYWQQHTDSIARRLARIPQDRILILVAHSGAGPLLPIIRQSTSHAIGAYIFVDAGIPRDNTSRLDLMKLEDDQWAGQFHQSLLQGGRFPAWKEADLLEVIPDNALCREMVAEIHPRALAFFTEPIPVFADWPDAPCAYIKFSAPYDWDFAQAKQAGWLVYEMDAGHFHMLVDPLAVTNVIVNAVDELWHRKPK